MLPGQLQRLFGIAGLGNQLPVGKPLQQPRQAGTDQGVIVDDENSHRHATGPCRGVHLNLAERARQALPVLHRNAGFQRARRASATWRRCRRNRCRSMAISRPSPRRWQRSQR
ncbi:hypothetical protein G6F32_016647 [Rhizopus arrhizus]|nr:hypothetical protein G6F32_016647 [Rhizopus arrhizus]